MIGKYMRDPVEINRHIYRKPLGYAGDFMVMNYIYDYHGKRYLGRNCYEQLINHYTSNIGISRSNIKRKEFFKEKILALLDYADSPRILSIGCGSARELIELIKEGEFVKTAQFTCFDLEEKALQFVRDSIEQIEKEKTRYLSMKYVHQNILFLLIHAFDIYNSV